MKSRDQKQEIQIREQEKLATIAAFKSLFAQKQAELVLKNLSKECYEDEMTFVKGDPSGSAFNNGKRYVILHIRRMINKEVEEQRQGKAKL